MSEELYEIYSPDAGELQVRLISEPGAYKTEFEIVDGFNPEFYMTVVMHGGGGLGHNCCVSGWAHFNYDENLLYWEHPRGGTSYVFSPERAYMWNSSELRIGLANFDKDYCSVILYDCEPEQALLDIM